MSTYQSLEIIPSVKDLKYLSDALNSPHKYIVLTKAHIGNLKNLVDLCHQANKKVIVNLELLNGFNADSIGIKLLKQQFKVDAVIAKGTSKINMAKAAGLTTIQRIVLEDSIALDASLKIVQESKADMIELRPGYFGMKFLEQFRQVCDSPYILSGFMSKKEHLEAAEKLGLFGVTTSRKDLWND